MQAVFGTMPAYLTDQILATELIVDPLTTLSGISYDRSSVIPYVEVRSLHILLEMKIMPAFYGVTERDANIFSLS